MTIFEDGFDSDAGVLTSTAIDLAPGIRTLQFKLAGTPTVLTSASAQADNVVEVSLGALFSDSYTIKWGAAFQTFLIELDVASATTASLAFANQGGDNVVAILDDVTLTSSAAVPEPGAALLIGRGLAFLAGSRRRSAGEPA